MTNMSGIFPKKVLDMVGRLHYTGDIERGDETMTTSKTSRPHQTKTEKEIRRMQTLIEAQIRLAFKAKNTQALTNLRQWELELQDELLVRC